MATTFPLKVVSQRRVQEFSENILARKACMHIPKPLLHIEAKDMLHVESINQHLYSYPGPCKYHESWPVLLTKQNIHQPQTYNTHLY